MQRKVRTIFGGPHVGGNSKRAQDRYAREARQQPLTNVIHLEQRPQKLQRVPDMDITFTEQDAREVHYPHNDALVIKINCGSTQLWRVLIDNGSAVDILYYDAFKKMGLSDCDLRPAVTPLYRFTGVSIMPRGMIELLVSVGTYPRVSMVITQFLVVDCPSTFNGVLGRLTLRELRAITSIIISP